MSRETRSRVAAARSLESFNYTIIAPYNIRANSNFTLSLTVHDAKSDFDDAILVRASIEDQNSNHVSKVNYHRYIVMNANTTEMVSIPVGNLPAEGKYKFVVKGMSGTNMEHQAELHLQTQRHMIFIQTDKASYKPNDCVKLRVLVMDLELRAALIEKNELKIDIFVRFSWIFMNKSIV